MALEFDKLKSFFLSKIYSNRPDFIENFIFSIINSQCVITDSFHGTVFSIIFNKPFISFVNKNRGKGRFDSLKEVLYSPWISGLRKIFF